MFSFYFFFEEIHKIPLKFVCKTHFSIVTLRMFKYPLRKLSCELSNVFLLVIYERELLPGIPVAEISVHVLPHYFDFDILYFLIILISTF